MYAYAASHTPWLDMACFLEIGSNEPYFQWRSFLDIGLLTGKFSAHAPWSQACLYDSHGLNPTKLQWGARDLVEKVHEGH